MLDVTNSDSLMAYRAACPSILARWRRDGDPVSGLLTALASVGVLPTA
jgi:hypothetical protein